MRMGGGTAPVVAPVPQPALTPPLPPLNVVRPVLRPTASDLTLGKHSFGGNKHQPVVLSN